MVYAFVSVFYVAPIKHFINYSHHRYLKKKKRHIVKVLIKQVIVQKIMMCVTCAIKKAIFMNEAFCHRDFCRKYSIFTNVGE